MTEKIIIAIVLLLIGAGLGATVEHWRMSGDVQQLTGEVNVLKGQNSGYVAANKQCGVNVAAVQTAVQGVVNDANKVNEAAMTAMNQVAGTAKRHQTKAEQILNAPRVAPAQQCAEIMKKQGEYLEYRRGLRMETSLKGMP